MFRRVGRAVEGCLEVGIPIICVHKGDASHLKYIFAQAKESNPKSDLILIGNSSNSYYSGVKHYNINDYFESAKEFERVYKHTNSHHPAHREIFYHQRYLVLNEFLQKHSIDSVFHIDSDILIFYNLKDLRALYPPAQLSLMHFPNDLPHAGSSFIDSKTIIKQLSDFIFEVYSDEAYFANLLSEHPDGIGEMTVLGEFKKRHLDKIINTLDPVEGKAMQLSMSHFPGMLKMYETEFIPNAQCDFNKIIWEDNIPFVNRLDAQKSRVQLTMLHMHGPCKAYAKNYCRLNTWSVKLLNCVNTLKYCLLRSPLRSLNKIYFKLFKKEIFSGLDPLS